MIFRTLLRAARLALAAAALMSGAANAQDYPSREIHFICGFPAGTGADTIVRYYAEKLRPIIGRTILVENRPGAGANIAIEYAAKSKADGYTILVHGGSGLASNMHVYKKPPVPTVDAFQFLRPSISKPSCWWWTPPSRGQRLPS